MKPLRVLIVDEPTARRLAIRGIELRINGEVVPVEVLETQIRTVATGIASAGQKLVDALQDGFVGQFNPMPDLFRPRRRAKPEKNRGPVPRRRHRR